MRLQEIVSPEVEAPVPDGVVKSCGNVHVLVHFSRMDCSNHRRYAMAVFQGDGIAQILVIGERIVAAVVHRPPGIGTPEQTPVGRNGTI